MLDLNKFVKLIDVWDKKLKNELLENLIIKRYTTFSNSLSPSFSLVSYSKMSRNRHTPRDMTDAEVRDLNEFRGPRKDGLSRNTNPHRMIMINGDNINSRYEMPVVDFLKGGAGGAPAMEIDDSNWNVARKLGFRSYRELMDHVKIYGWPKAVDTSDEEDD